MVAADNPGEETTVSFGEAIQTVFRKYAEFTGRAPRAEFWWWALFNLLVASALSLFNVIPIGDDANLGSLLVVPSPFGACVTPTTAGARCSGSWCR
jgi:uncharacterized membrane protein YhaH (DUF805 family)